MFARLLRRASIGALALTLIGASGAASARADNVIADGDGLTPVVANALPIGSVACGATTTKTVALAISRNGGGANNPNIFAGSAVVTVTVAATNGAGLSATAPADKITLPSGWVSSDNNTLSSVVYASVTLTSTTPGAGSGTVTYSASGRSQDGVSTTTVASTMNVSWTTGTCVTTTPTTTTVTCPTVHQTYTGAALQPCTAAVTGSNGFSQVLPVTYTPNTNAGSVTATASFAGDATHLASSGSSGFVIDKAPSTTTVTCPPSVTYDSTPQTPCTASYTGVALPSATSVTPTYTNNTDAGTASAAASWSGDGNHTASQGSKDFTITKASSTTTISCDASGLSYTGAHLAPCTAEAMGVGLPKRAVTVTYAPNDVDAGPVTATASYGGDSNHEPSNTATAKFTIGQASTVTSLTCDSAAQTFDGTHHAICSATVTGPNGFTAPVPVTYDDDLNAGTVHVTAAFDGSSGNYASSSANTSFVIARAQPVITVTCTPAVVTYDGTPQKPCSASVSGPAMPSQALDVAYVDNVEAGTATAGAKYVETANYLAATGSSTFQINPTASTLTVSCVDAVYDGSPRTPCTATVSGDGVIDPDVAIAYTYSGNTDAGSSAAVTAKWPGDRNHTASSATAVFSIDKAPSTVSVKCPTSVTFTGEKQTPCTASVEGPGVKTVDDAHPILWAYTNNLHAGLASVSAIWDGDANHYGSHSDAVTFGIDKAGSTVSLICPANVTFTGAPQTPCSATASGAGMVDVTLTPDYTNNVSAGTAHATASWAGDEDHTASNDGKTFTIDKATSSVTVTCPTSATYTGSAIEPCTATASGVGGLNQDLTVTYEKNTGAGTAMAMASFKGDDNHTGSSNSATFTIDKATSSVTVTCPTSATYTGFAIEPCTATAGGVGGLNQDLSVTYEKNTAAGTATASAGFPGDDNHTASSNSATFTIDKATSSVTVTCPTSATYTGSAIEPCTAEVTGAGGLKQALTVTYDKNTDAGAGTATASASYAGDSNHLGGDGSATFTIDKAPSQVTVTCNPSSVTFTGSPIEPCTARATGVGGLDTSASVSYAHNVEVGTATATGTYAGDANHLASTGSGTFTIGSWTPSGFYQPVDMGATLNTVKNGSTVPLKFEVFRDGVELTSTSIVTSFTATMIACQTSAPVDDIEFTTTGGTSLRYDTTAGQFVQNWQTPKKPGTCYLVTMTTQDKSTVKAQFKLK